MKRFALGFLCLVIYAIFSPYYADSYYLTDEYEVRTTICSSIIAVHAHVFQCKTSDSFEISFLLSKI